MTPLSELKSLSQILQLFHHRNKNQHRVARWWHPFSELRRCVAKLVVELGQSLEGAEREGGKKGMGKEGEEEEEEVVVVVMMQRVKFLEDFLIERCFLAFSTLMADSQFAALGLLLMGALARLRTVVGVLSAEEHGKGPGQEEREVVGGGEVGRLGDGLGDEDVDFGQKIAREGVEGVRKGKRVLASEEEGGVAVEMPSKKPRKKKRKKRDEFDDLFAGLV
ncbi:hypothetical protein B7494_g7963 [Chlorociboria aeruginascens]|nr:hypothetical protein B7494_g7963 [Chlorociboria aeruginascens]